MKKGWNSFFYFTLAQILFAGSCSYLPVQQTGLPAQATAEEEPDVAVRASTGLQQEESTAAIQTAAPRYGQQQILEMGTGEFIARPEQASRELIETDEGDITLNFQDTDLREFIKVILGDVLGSNYVIDPKVGGRVTIETSVPVNKEELLPLFEDILGMNGAAMVKSGGIFQILPKNQAVRGKLAPSVIEQPGEDGYNVRIIPLTYVAAQEMQKILEPFLSEGGNLRIDIKRNLVIVTGTRQELDLIQETISIFDVDWMRGMSMGLYPLTYVDPKTLKTELDSIIGAVEGEGNQELLGGLVRSVPIERLNSILLISSTPTALREVEIWIHRLDKPGEHVGKRLYVYNVQNAKAIELAEILGHIFGGTGSSGSPNAATSPRAPELAPGLTPVEISSDAPATATTPETTASTPGSRGVGEAGVALPTGDSIEIIADDVRNALVVLASPQEYKMVEAAIKKLDVVPLQVLIEASILEVTLRDELSYGVEWFFKHGIDSEKVKGGRGALDLGEGNTLAAPVPSFAYTIVSSAEEVRFAISALENESVLNVLSSPSLMVLDNQTAVINVGDEIPVPTRQSVSNLDPNAPTVNEIQFRQTGVTLTVTPRVNSSGLVTMEIKQEVSNAVSTTTSTLDAPTIQNRLIESVVAINSGETIVLGGLIQDTDTDSESGVPVLRKIPLLGKLFSQTNDERLRTELLVLITPRVVGNRNDARNITDEFRRKLRGIPPLEMEQKINPEQAPS